MKKRNANAAKDTPVQPMSAPSSLALITTEALAAMIHWHPESVRRACRQGRVQAVKLGRGWRVSPEVVQGIAQNGIPSREM